MSTAKIQTVNNYKAKEWNGKYIHEWDVTGVADGEAQKFIVTMFSPSKEKPDLPIGQDVELEYAKEYQGIKQYKYRKSGGGGYSGGGKGGYQKNDAAIAAMSALKTAVEYATKALPDCAPEDVTEIANRFLKWIKENS